MSMCIHVKFMSKQNVTVHVNYLLLCSASLHLSLVLSVEAFFTLTLRHDGPRSTVGLACALEWLSATQVAVTDPGIVLYCLSLTDVLNLGLTSESSEVSLSVSDLFRFAGPSFVSSAIRLLLLLLLLLWA